MANRNKTGRPRVGKLRTFHCPDTDYNRVRLVSELQQVPAADVIREALSQFTQEFLEKHAQSLSGVSWSDCELQQAAEEFLVELKAKHKK